MIFTTEVGKGTLWGVAVICFIPLAHWILSKFSEEEAYTCIIHRPKEVTTAAALLYKSALMAIIEFLGGNLLSGISIPIDTILAGAILRMRYWSRVSSIIRSAVGIAILSARVTFMAIAGHLSIVTAVVCIFNLICLVGILTSLTSTNVRNSNWT